LRKKTTKSAKNETLGKGPNQEKLGKWASDKNKRKKKEGVQGKTLTIALKRMYLNGVWRNDDSSEERHRKKGERGGKKSTNRTRKLRKEKRMQVREKPAHERKEGEAWKVTGRRNGE